jgi:Flp pilus assembly pilin Flp
MKFVKKFVEMCRDEDGAVTIEYVALAAAVVSLGAVASTVLDLALTGATISGL